MGFMDKLSGRLGLTDNSEEETDKSNEIERPKMPEPKVIPAFKAVDPPPTAPIEGFAGGGHKVVDFHAASTRRDSAMSMTRSKINTIKPKTFDHAQDVANSLRDKVPVIINFEETDTETAKRIIDFISGTTYALNGEIKKVSQNVFVCAPQNVTVTYTEEEKKVTGEIPWLTK